MGAFEVRDIRGKVVGVYPYFNEAKSVCDLNAELTGKPHTVVRVMTLWSSENAR